MAAWMAIYSQKKSSCQQKWAYKASAALPSGPPAKCGRKRGTFGRQRGEKWKFQRRLLTNTPVATHNADDISTLYVSIYIYMLYIYILFIFYSMNLYIHIYIYGAPVVEYH